MTKETGNIGLHSVTGGSSFGTASNGFSYSIFEDGRGFIAFHIKIDTQKHKKLPEKEIIGRLKGFAIHFEKLITKEMEGLKEKLIKRKIPFEELNDDSGEFIINMDDLNKEQLKFIINYNKTNLNEKIINSPGNNNT